MAEGVDKATAKVVGDEVVEVIRRRRTPEMANEIRALSSVSSVIVMDTTPINVRMRRRKRRRRTMHGRWSSRRQCYS